MVFKETGTIKIPGAGGSSFDHGAFDPMTRRVFLAHTGRDCVEVFDYDARKHIATLSGFAEAAGVAADEGIVLITNRGSASLAWVDARDMKTQGTFKTGLRPNGIAVAARQRLAIVACISNDTSPPTLETIGLDTGKRHAITLPGRPRWCVTDQEAGRVFLAIREPSMVLVARLPDLSNVQHWPVPVGGAHGLDIDHQRNRLYVACDDAALVEIDARSGSVTHQWRIAGAPDVTFFNPVTGRVHVAIGDPGLVQSFDPRTGASSAMATGAGAHTTALTPDGLYVFSPAHHAALTYLDVR